MAKRRNALCRQCDGHRDIVGRLSRNGLCATCAVKNNVTQAIAMRDVESHQYRKWALSMQQFAAKLATVTAQGDPPSDHNGQPVGEWPVTLADQPKEV